MNFFLIFAEISQDNSQHFKRFFLTLHIFNVFQISLQNFHDKTLIIHPWEIITIQL
jgi:hypothetical protein